MIRFQPLIASGFCLLIAGDVAAAVERVTTVVPFPRGLEMIEDHLYVLGRGRVRGAGGVTADIDDKAGYLFPVNPDLAEPLSGDVGHLIANDGEIFAEPSDPPFRLWNRDSAPPWTDRETDRPYCVLRFHEPTQSFYICAFSGVDKPGDFKGRNFSKNLTDGILRYDLRTKSWHEVERHDIEAGGVYPHHDPASNPPPHGWLNGPNNILPVGNSLYAVAKDNSVLARYDLSALVDDPNAGAAPGEVLQSGAIRTTNAGDIQLRGHSALAAHGDWLYVATRTSGHIIRLKLTGEHVVTPLVAELVARVDPWNPETRHSADVTDMTFDDSGRLYLVSAKPSRVYRFAPDPERIFDARDGREKPWMDFAALTNNPSMKSENIFIDENQRLFVTSGDGYDFQYGASGTVYRVAIED